MVHEVPKNELTSLRFKCSVNSPKMNSQLLRFKCSMKNLMKGKQKFEEVPKNELMK